MSSFGDNSQDQPRDASGQFAATNTPPTNESVLDEPDPLFEVVGSITTVDPQHAPDDPVSQATYDSIGATYHRDGAMKATGEPVHIFNRYVADHPSGPTTMRAAIVMHEDETYTITQRGYPSDILITKERDMTTYFHADGVAQQDVEKIVSDLPNHQVPPATEPRTISRAELSDSYNTTRQQISNGVLMSLGAHKFRSEITPEGNPALVFNARILTKPGGAVRVMKVSAEIEPNDTYRVRATYPKKSAGQYTDVDHHDIEGVHVGELNRVLFSFDQVQ